MDGNVFPDQEQLLGFLKKLKEVFDVCDEDADGFIRVEHLVDLGLQFGQGDEVRFSDQTTVCRVLQMMLRIHGQMKINT